MYRKLINDEAYDLVTGAGTGELEDVSEIASGLESPSALRP
ncbi:MAG TPA: hypothetical protein VG057_12085 [Solirubrobacteraceae bacterium]|nr:hypothetical protein [Solirubrobacteraceae bacterium]